jgi:hypothetical protein
MSGGLDKLRENEVTKPVYDDVINPLKPKRERESSAD